MAINLLDENKYIKCPICNGNYFKEEAQFRLKKVDDNSDEKIIKAELRNVIVCTNCNTIIKKM